MGSEDRYILWNYMLAEHCLLADSCEGTVLLTVTPRTLVIALEEAGEASRSPKDAEADLTAAVASVYRGRVLGSSDKLRALKSGSSSDVPFGIGFLALSVLAAFHMRTDDEHTGRAFYPRLAEMLGCDLVRSHPAGFDGDAFLELWDELAAWLKARYNRELAVPAGSGVRRYVAYPFAHVPLRQVDIERLPQFFDAHDYEPGARAPIDRIKHDLYDAAGPWRYFTESGQSALRDIHRRAFVVQQVAHELDRWDGCRVDATGARTASIELWMDIRRRRAQLSLLARRPAGFPDSIENGDLMFVSSQEGWYEPILLGRDDGALLQEGIRVGTQHSGHAFHLQLRPSRVLPLTPSESYTGFVSDRVLRADTDCAVLCVEELADEVARYLETVTNRSVRPRRDEALPTGWCLFTEIRAIKVCAPPAGLESLVIESSLALVPEGGLRLGRRWVWLESAPARLTVLGSHRDLAAKIDDQDVPITNEGRIETRLLETAGQHVVEIGNRLRQRVLVLPGSVNPDCQAWSEAEAFDYAPIVIPEGNWILVGRVPGQYGAAVGPPEGTLVRAPFAANWAVRVGISKGATALHVHDRGQVSFIRNFDARRAATQKRNLCWADTIYQAGIRRPNFICPHGCTSLLMQEEWSELMESARAIKRAKRSRR